MMYLIAWVVVFVGFNGVAWAQLRAGDVAVIAYTTEGTDSFAWVGFRDMPSNTVIHFTSSSVSNGWFRWGDHLGRAVGPGPLTWTATNLVKAGTVISWVSGTPKCWTVGAISGGVPSLSFSGDQIFAYTGSIVSNSAGTAPWIGDAGPATLLFGLNFANGGWDNITGGGGTSYIPAGLSTNNATAVHAGLSRNAWYSGPLAGSASEIRAALACPGNWTDTTNAVIPSFWSGGFKVRPTGGGMMIQIE